MDSIPRGVEVLVKKASVDRDFRVLLLEKRSRAADAIGLALEPAEALMLDGVPAAQLESIIDHTTVPPSRRQAFLGTAAAVMLAALGAASCDVVAPKVTGIAPDHPPRKEGTDVKPDTTQPTVKPATAQPAPTTAVPVPQGIRPDPPPVTKGTRPDRPDAVTRGVRPDRP